MKAAEFITKWKASTLTERSASQSFFNDCCALVGVETPSSSDPKGDWFTFEKGAKKTGGGDGWADVWRKGCFAWEMKGKHKDLGAALAQLQRYAPALENPPLLIVSDMDRIEIHTNFTNTVHAVETLNIEDLSIPEKLHRLRLAFIEPEKLRPALTRIKITEQAAAEFAELAKRLRERGFEPQRVAHFNTKLLFCLFAEDIGLLPNRLFSKIIETACRQPGSFKKMAGELFEAMRNGGTAAFEPIEWFNGGLFEDSDVLPLDVADLQHLREAAKLEWDEIEPSIFGTLFERGLDPDKRSQLGAHYTDRNSIERIVRPVVFDLLESEWAGTRAEIEAAKTSKSKRRHFGEFLAKLRDFRVLDPACGSGNFLYIALLGIRDFESRVLAEAEELELGQYLSYATGPHNVLGIEVNPYAAELARLTVWIGDIQWAMRHHGGTRRPILEKLDHIDCRDAVMNADGSEPDWPAADCIVGNPPFLGDKKMIEVLGEDYVTRLRTLYEGRVPGGADLVTYWFEKARAQLAERKAKRAGLVATNSIRDGRSRAVLDRIRSTESLINVWSDQPWVLDGAAVRVSLICFDGEKGAYAVLDGRVVDEIFSDLTAGIDLTAARPLPENKGQSFFGLCLAGAFGIPGNQAREWLTSPNPHGRPNAEVLRPIYNGKDVTERYRDRWVIDFGTSADEATAALYEKPFEHIVNFVKPLRLVNRERSRAERWWLHGRPRPELREALVGLTRYIVTSETAKHRVFVWLPISVAPEHKLVVIPRGDDLTIGILSSRFHVLWALALGATLEDRPVYSKERCFDTFPFPQPAPEQVDVIAQAARELVRLRENWLNPEGWLRRVPEVVPGYPDRLLPVNEKAATELKARTLTRLYNQRPTWLAQAHARLDDTVAAAYGWPPEIAEDEVLNALLRLNQRRAENAVAVPATSSLAINSLGRHRPR